ncbi:MAG: nucleotide exchange factor GrpE [Verrucomicrobia bacterium]|nr:nucleotide exchange factor GrpE [Pseudomonadota bacterium]NBV96303.1 nucleotide exchange factor GrpE [Verrucomicrobiota bacterium]NBY66653.1 nucleotide exchange factor GrpE [Verrucomicrobiota bacterium]
MKSKHPHPPAESAKESPAPGPTDSVETAPPAPVPDPAAQAAAEIASLKDQLLRARADFENSRKRLIREKEESLRYANQAILADLLPLLDHLELGLQAASTATDVPSVVSGVKLIQSQFERFLTEHGVTPVEALGKPFDPNWHEAIGQEPAPGKPEGTVLHLRRRGFKLGERLLRPASVITVAPPSA